MGRYETYKNVDILGIRSVKIKDKETDETEEGYGRTYTEAGDNAWKKLKSDKK